MLAAASLLSAAHAAPAGGNRQARLAVYAFDTSVTQTQAGSGWTLTKTGQVDAATSTVTWQINAGQSGTPQNTLTVTGRVVLLNLGNAPATLGNIVISLDARTGSGNPSSSWTTLVSNVADATHGDAATRVQIIGPSDGDADEDDDAHCPQGVSVRTVSEGAGSGALSFTEGPSLPWSLSPGQSIPAGGSLDLRFTATFNNSVLNLANGRTIRPQIIVTQGNAGSGPRTLANVDIDGSGSISADEARVRSKARNLGQKSVPAATGVASSAVAITDTAADITTTGDVTFSDPVFSLGATSGTAQLSYASGASGGTITNCAHLTGGATATACNTQSISGTPSAHVWQDGEVITYSQDDWGGTPVSGNAAQLLTDAFVDVYSGNGVEIGVIGTAGYSTAFSTATAVLSYLPSNGAPNALTSDSLDATSTAAGEFGGEVLAFEFNHAFSAAGRLGAYSFGDLYLCNYDMSTLDGLTVNDLLAEANVALGGGSTAIDISALDTLLHDLDASFRNGVVTQYARDHLFIGACP